MRSSPLHGCPSNRKAHGRRGQESFFHRGELFAWLANTGHWPDTGGMVPGGFSVNVTEVESEGLRTISIVDEDLGLSGATAHRSVLQ